MKKLLKVLKITGLSIFGFLVLMFIIGTFFPYEGSGYDYIPTVQAEEYEMDGEYEYEEIEKPEDEELEETHPRQSTMDAMLNSMQATGQLDYSIDEALITVKITPDEAIANSFTLAQLGTNTAEWNALIEQMANMSGSWSQNFPYHTVSIMLLNPQNVDYTMATTFGDTVLHGLK